MLKKISSTIQTQQDVAVLEDTVANQKRQIASLEQKLSKHEQLSADYQTQQSRLEKYERKLRDLVSAYQSVVKEKEALKQIVQSFDSTSLVSVSTDHDDTVSIASETSVNEPEYWQQRIQNLQSAVNTLSDEKNKMESAYICEKKKLRQQVEELEEKITEVENQLKEEQSRCEGLASQLKQCNESLEVMRNEWQRAQNDLSLQEYRKDQEDAMEALKVQFEQMKSSLAEERVKALLVENAASNAVKRAEERVGKMENELRELSAAVGAYESLRTTDQNAIEHLRNQIDQLHIENSMLAKAVGHDTPSDSNLTTEHLHSKYIHFRDLLRTACTTSEIPFPGDEETSHLKHEIDKLKKECERYKESFSRNSLSTKKNDSSNEKVVNLQEKNCYLRHQLNAATSKCSQLQAELEALTTKHSSELHSLKKEHSYSLDELERKWSNKLRQTELDASAYRDRVQTILDENELEKQDLLSQVHKNEESPLSPTKTSSTLLHWTEERARWQRELTTIRDERHSLQSQVRGLQSIRSLNEDEWNSKFQLLKKEIEVLQKRVSREGSNLEYLKNVFFNFLTCREPSARSNMLTAIMNVIQFTSSEVEQMSFDDTDNLSIVDYCNYLYSAKGWDTMVKTFTNLNIRAKVPKQFTNTKYAKRILKLSYQENCRHWKPLWARQCRGVILFLEQTSSSSYFTCLKLQLLRGPEMLTAFHLQASINESQDVNHDSPSRWLSMFPPSYVNMMTKFVKREEQCGYLTSKADGSLLSITIYEGRFASLIRQWVVESGDDFSRMMLDLAEEYSFVPILSTRDTFSVTDHMLSYTVTGILDGLGICSYREISLLAKKHKPESVFQMKGAAFIKRISNIRDDIRKISQFKGSEPITICFENVVKDRRCCWGVLHRELAVSYSKSNLVVLGVGHTNKMVFYPHFMFGNLWQKHIICEPLWWRITHSIQVDSMLVDLSRCLRGTLSTSDFLNLHKPGQQSLSDKGDSFVFFNQADISKAIDPSTIPFDYEGFVFYSDELESGKVKTEEYYKCHKFKVSNIMFLVNLAHTNQKAFPSAHAIASLHHFCEKQLVPLCREIVNQFELAEDNGLLNGFSRKVLSSYHRQPYSTQMRMILNCSPNVNDMLFGLFAKYLPLRQCKTDRKDINEILRKFVEMLHPWDVEDLETLSISEGDDMFHVVVNRF